MINIFTITANFKQQFVSENSQNSQNNNAVSCLAGRIR